MPLGEINFLAVGLGIVANMVLGFLWYGPVFGKYWLKIQAARGRKTEDMEADPFLYIQTAVLAAISHLVLAILIARIEPAGAVAGAMWGALIWVGVGAAGMRNNGLFEEIPAASWFLFSSYYLIIYLAFGAIYTVW